MRLRALAASAMLLAALAGGAAAETVLRLGVRADAEPMAYRAGQGVSAATGGPLGAAGYAGFVVHVCDAAAIELQRRYGRDLRFEVTALEAAEIYDALSDGRVDVFCGPTTATRARLEGRIASPPIFISGITFATRAGDAPRGPCRSVAGSVRGATARTTGIERILEAGAWHASADRVREALSSIAGATDGGDAGAGGVGACADGSPVAPALVDYPTHRALAEAFCAGEVRHYVGDHELVVASLAAQRLRTPGCEATMSDRTFTEERYVILGDIGSGGAGVKEAVAFYFEALSRRILFAPSVLDEAFDATFESSRPSRKLELLFWAMRGNAD